MTIKTRAEKTQKEIVEAEINYFLLGFKCVRIGPEFDSRYQLNCHYFGIFRFGLQINWLIWLDITDGCLHSDISQKIFELESNSVLRF